MTYLILFLSVLIGALFVICAKPNRIITQVLIAFSGAYLLATTVLYLLPELYKNGTSAKIGLFILVGVLIQSILENFSKGIEHGHAHLHTNNHRVPWLLIISLCIHSFLEGLPITHENTHHLLYAIVIHKIPIAIVVTSFLTHAKVKKSILFFVLVLFASMTPLGVFFNDSISVFQTYQQEINALIIGVFLHISTIILFESSDNHTFNFKKFIAIILGFGISYLSLYS